MLNQDRISDELSAAVSQELNHHKTQVENYKAKFHDEKKRVCHLEQEMHKLKEGHREEVNIFLMHQRKC